MCRENSVSARAGRESCPTGGARSGTVDSAREGREGGAKPQREDRGRRASRARPASAMQGSERRRRSDEAARRAAGCGRVAPPAAGAWARAVPDAPTKPPRGRSSNGAEAARRSLPQGGDRRSPARRAKRRRAARTSRPRSGPCARTGKYQKSVEGGRNAGRQAARGGAADGARRSRRRRRTPLRRADGTKRTAAADRAPRPAFRPVRLGRPPCGRVRFAVRRILGQKVGPRSERPERSCGQRGNGADNGAGAAMTRKVADNVRPHPPRGARLRRRVVRGRVCAVFDAAPEGWRSGRSRRS